MRFLVQSTALALFCTAFPFYGQLENTISTQQTVIRVRADQSSPRLLSVQTPGASAWTNDLPELLIPYVYVGKSRISTNWKLNSTTVVSDPSHISYQYETQNPHLTLKWNWDVRDPGGPIEHSIRIENHSSAVLTIPLQTSLSFQFRVSHGQGLEHIYIDKGAGKPDSVGTHVVQVDDSYAWTGESSTYALDGDKEVIPAFFIQRQNASQDGWYTGIEYSGRTSLSVRRTSGHVYGTAGLNPRPGPFLTSIQPGESFVAPTIFIGAYSGGLDHAGIALRAWVRHALGNPSTWANPHYPWLVNNSWGSGMQVDESLAKRMIDDSSELGLEMFHIDAGWFRGVGDWYPSPAKFPQGMRSISDYAHQKGLKFGIWVNWAEAGTDTEPGSLNVHNASTRSWMVADAPADWTPKEFIGRTIDLGVPAAANYAATEVDRMVREYGLDMIEHDGYVVAKMCSRTDHLHKAPPVGYSSLSNDRGLSLPLASSSTDVSYHATQAYYSIYSREREKHPDLLFEICNDGGRMVDFGSAAHGDYFSITDTYDPLSNRQAFYDASHLFPAAMLESYVEKWPTPRIENFRYMLRSGMMGWLTIMQDTNAWSPTEHEEAKREFSLYKQELRPLIRDAELYHVSDRPDGVHWDGIEYYAPHLHKGVVYVFRGSEENQNTHTFHLKGLDAQREYKVHFYDQTRGEYIALGQVLMQQGVEVELKTPLSSELLFLTGMDK